MIGQLTISRLEAVELDARAINAKFSQGFDNFARLLLPLGLLIIRVAIAGTAAVKLMDLALGDRLHSLGDHAPRVLARTGLWASRQV